ncbi:hypothetical protein M959_15298, partial [Chaetura pelagica]
LVQHVQHQQPRVRVGHAAAQQLQVREVLVGVGVEAASRLVLGVRKKLAHLLVEVAPLVGDFHGDTVAELGVDDAARGDLGLQQADGVFPHNELLLHGLEEGDLEPGVGLGVAPHGSFRRQQLVIKISPDESCSQCLCHRQLLVPHGVGEEPGGSLGFQQHQGCTWGQQPPHHGIIDAHLL